MLYIYTKIVSAETATLPNGGGVASSEQIIQFYVDLLAKGVHFNNIRAEIVCKEFGISVNYFYTHLFTKKRLYEVLVKYYKDHKLPIPKTLRFLNENNTPKENILEFCVGELDGGIYFEKITLPYIGREFGVHRLVIARHFPTEEALYNAIFRDYTDKGKAIPKTLIFPSRENILKYCLEQINNGISFADLSLTGIASAFRIKRIQIYYATREDLHKTLVKHYTDNGWAIPKNLEMISNESVLNFCVQELAAGKHFRELTFTYLGRAFDVPGTAILYFSSYENLYNDLIQYYTSRNLPLPEGLNILHKKPISRELIIEFCVKLLNSGTYFEKIFFHDIAKEFGIVTTSIRKYFHHSKEELYKALDKYYTDHQLPRPQTLKFMSKTTIVEFCAKLLKNGIFFHKITGQMICREFGLSGEAIDHYFHSRKDLYETLVKHYHSTHGGLPKTLQHLSEENIIQFCFRKLEEGMYFEQLTFAYIAENFGIKYNSVTGYFANRDIQYNTLVKYYTDRNIRLPKTLQPIKIKYTRPPKKSIMEFCAQQLAKGVPFSKLTLEFISNEFGVADKTIKRYYPTRKVLFKALDRYYERQDLSRPPGLKYFSKPLVLEFCAKLLEQGWPFAQITYRDICREFKVTEAEVLRLFAKREYLFHALERYYFDTDKDFPETLKMPEES